MGMQYNTAFYKILIGATNIPAHKMTLDNLDATVLHYLNNGIMSLGVRPEGGRDGERGREGKEGGERREGKEGRGRRGGEGGEGKEGRGREEGTIA